MSTDLETVDGRPALRVERRLSHPVERVRRAVTESMGEPGRVTEVQAPSLLAWDWGDEQLRVELRPDGDGCVLTLVYVFGDRSLGAQHGAGWECYLDRVAALLEGGELSEEDAHAPIAERHERLARELGLDPAPGRRTIAGMAVRGLTLEPGPVLRLERRFGHPPQRLWRALTDPAELARWFPSGEAMVPIEQREPELLVATWYGDTLRFELRADGAGCGLIFTHAFADRDTAARTAAGWDRAFARVDALLAGTEMDERASLEDWPAVHERYAQAWGVDPEIGRRAFADHPLT